MTENFQNIKTLGFTKVFGVLIKNCNGDGKIVNQETSSFKPMSKLDNHKVVQLKPLQNNRKWYHSA